MSHNNLFAIRDPRGDLMLNSVSYVPAQSWSCARLSVGKLSELAIRVDRTGSSSDSPEVIREIGELLGYQLVLVRPEFAGVVAPGEVGFHYESKADPNRKPWPPTDDDSASGDGEVPF